MAATTKTIGDKGEDLAAEYLVRKSYTIVERNYRQRFAEIDLIAMKDGVLVFCEVKRSRFEGESHPEIRVDSKKQIKIARCARVFLAGSPPPFHSCRFDIITVKKQRGKDYVEHITNAFWPPEGWDEE